MDEKHTKNIECGLRLRGCRKKKGLSQEKLAEMSDYSIQTVSYIENGKRNMTRDAAHAFSCILGVREEYLLCEDNAKTLEDLFSLEDYQTYKIEQMESVLHAVGCWEHIEYGDVVERLGTSELVNIDKIILCLPNEEFITCSESAYKNFLDDMHEYILCILKQFSKKCQPSTEEEIEHFQDAYFWHPDDR